MRIALWQIVLLLSLCIGFPEFHRELAVSASEMKQNMDERWEREAEEEFTRSWSERRGIESIDRNAEVILVKVPLNDLSTALEARATESRRDVLGSEIEVSGSFVFAYQLVGHTWSIIVPDGYPEPLGSTKLAQLSKQLGQPVIRLTVSDSSGVIGYDLFEGGEIAEYFAGSEDELTEEPNEYGLQPQRYVLSPYPDDDPELVQTAHFWSRRRHVTVEEIGNIWDFAWQLLLEYDAFDPALDSKYFLGAHSLRQGGRHQVQNQGITLVLPGRKVTSVPDLVRVDYFRFGD